MLTVIQLLTFAASMVGLGTASAADAEDQLRSPSLTRMEAGLARHVAKELHEGRQIFRFDTFGDEAFWGDALQLHQAIQGERFGGVGPGLSPRKALAAGLKVDVDALPRDVVKNLRLRKVNLDDAAVTLLLLRVDAWSGSKGSSTQAAP